MQRLVPDLSQVKQTWQFFKWRLAARCGPSQDWWREGTAEVVEVSMLVAAPQPRLTPHPLPQIRTSVHVSSEGVPF